MREFFMRDTRYLSEKSVCGKIFHVNQLEPVTRVPEKITLAPTSTRVISYHSLAVGFT